MVWHLMRVTAVLVGKMDLVEDQVPVWAGAIKHAGSPDKVKAALGPFVLELVLCYLCALML